MMLDKAENLYDPAIILYNIQVLYAWLKKAENCNLSEYFHY